MAAFPLPNRISQASSANYDQKSITSAYGDGYEQRVAVGINNIVEMWNLQLNNLSLAERNTFIAFYRAHGRVNSFTWTPPNGTLLKFVFTDAISETNNGDRYSFTMNIKQVFEA